MSNVLDAIMSQYEKNKNSSSGSSFPEKTFEKYFNPRLEDGEKKW